MSGSNVSIDGKRLLADLYRLREFGTYKTGVHRPTFSPVGIAAVAWSMRRRPSMRKVRSLICNMAAL